MCTCVHAMQISTSFIVPAILIAANELDLFEIIVKEDGPAGACLSPSDIASHLRAQNPNAPSVLDQMLHLLTSHSHLICSSRILENEDGKVEKLYGLAPAGKLFVKDANGVSLAPMIHLGSFQVVMEMSYA